MSTKKLTLSLIIPVFNGERHIRKTLEAVQAQTVMPDEVLVVDNNSADRSVAIAQEFDFVRVIRERRQGLTYARNAGFNAAKGDILGRIDVDSQLHPDWTEKVLKRFSQSPKTDGIAGMGVTPLIPYLRRPRGTFHMRAYYYNVHSYFRTVIMWGGNTAIRKSAWQRVKHDVTLGDSKMHEDQDLTLWMVAKKCNIAKAYDVKVSSYDQSFRYLPKMVGYVSKRNRTARLHRKLGNLPVKHHSLSTLEILGSHVLEVPALTYGLLAGVITLPIDWFAVEVLKSKTWFD